MATYFLCSKVADEGPVTLVAGPGVTVRGGKAACRYPIVLAHGMGGSGEAYFGKLPQRLAEQGARVYVTRVPALGDTLSQRGPLLQAQVEAILAHAGVEQVHLIGHGQGVLDCRMVAGLKPEWAASLTGVAGPNWGSPVADALLGHEVAGWRPTRLELAGLRRALARALRGLGLRELPPAALDKSLRQLSTMRMKRFNIRFPAGLHLPRGQVNSSLGIPYFSWTGAGAGPLWRRLGGDWSLWLTGQAFGEELNDGLVGQASARLGTVLGEKYRLSHFSGRSSKAQELYLQQAARLKGMGL